MGGCVFLAVGRAVVGYGRRMIRGITSVVESKLCAVKRSLQRPNYIDIGREA